MKGFSLSHCIDGKLLNRLHPKGFSCSEKGQKGSESAADAQKVMILDGTA